MNYKTLLLTGLLSLSFAACAMDTDTTSTSTSSDSSSSSSDSSSAFETGMSWVGHQKEQSRLDELFCLEK